MAKNLTGQLLQEPEEVTASMRPDDEAPQEEKRRERRPPLLAVSLVRKATNVDSSISVEEMCNRIYRGVLMNDNKLKFWVDEDLEKNCFLLLAEGLFIAGGDETEHWGWTNEKEQCFSSEVEIPVAELLDICWLEFSGKFKTIKLSPKTTYEVAFVVKMRDDGSGLHGPVNLTLTLPDGTTQGRIENMEETPKGEWRDIPVGTFMTTPQNVGEISFSYCQVSGHWKSGLIVKGAVLRPKD
ncbi:uncharacterized protein PHLOEM PROTEIN 2-LIKE A4-like [Rhodamnia argentea]|uniref:Uncharacterized protein PHLOEM PROTEIN 2-LIKE A4-like n=1 Tax=Rhodamnia argentea TaxID=178133 RepID=A0A8B8N4W8_9MYRT|nr:uncharacterized protein PHLOEM PROTEIN 2-LIKE A4-like [Rhodamnia argentea]